MRVDVAASAMIGSQVKDDLDSSRGRSGDPGVEEILVPELHPSGFDVRGDVFEEAAAEIVDNAYSGAPNNKCVHEVGADERSSARNQHPPILPMGRHRRLPLAILD